MKMSKGPIKKGAASIHNSECSAVRKGKKTNFKMNAPNPRK